MGFLSAIFGKKKKEEKKSSDDVFYPGESDGQDMYFKEDFEQKPKKKASVARKSNEQTKISPKKEAQKEKIEIKSEAESKKQPAVVKKGTAKPSASKASQSKSEEKPRTAAAAPAPAKKSTAKAPTAVSKASSAAKESKGGYTGKFEIKKAKDGRFVFNLYAPNHIIVATSQTYSTSSAAVNGIQSIIANAEGAPVEDNTLKNPTKQPFPKWEMYIDKGSEYRFRLYASNGNCIVHSQGYKQKSSCKNGIDSIIRCSRNAEIDKSYLKNSK